MPVVVPPLLYRIETSSDQRGRRLHVQGLQSKEGEGQCFVFKLNKNSYRALLQRGGGKSEKGSQPQSSYFSDNSDMDTD